MPIGRFFVDQILQKARRDFAAQFMEEHYALHRQRFRWNLERLYREKYPNSSPGDLPKLIRNIKWPADFPPDHILDYANNINWPNDEGQKFWEFSVEIYSPAFGDLTNKDKSDDRTALYWRLYNRFQDGRRVSSRFWDHWAREMREGRLLPKSIRDPLEANYCDIRALAVSELVFARMVGWDNTPGRSALFFLARDHLNIVGGGRLRRTRRYAAGQLQRLVNWIRPDG